MTKSHPVLRIACLLTALLLAGCASPPQRQAAPGRDAPEKGRGFSLVEAGVAELRGALDAGLVSAGRLVALYAARISAYDRDGPMLRSVLLLSPLADAEARTLDEAAASSSARRGPLHGIPVLLKDNIDAAGLPTTAGALALAGTMPPGDAFLVRRLREAGAVILGKGQLTELANHVSDSMPAGYSAVGGQTLNPWDPRPLPGGDGRPVLSPGGSSSGPAVAVTANLAALAVGTETAGSILSPAAANGIVGIRPTLGLVSRGGIVPLSADQDTPGPLARTVADAALLLGVIAGHDAADPATAACLVPGRCYRDYVRFLDAAALRGARLLLPPYPVARTGIMESAVAALEGAGATVVRRETPLPPVGVASTLDYAFQRDLGARLAAVPPPSGVRSLQELVAYNAATPGAARYGQSRLIDAAGLSLDPASAASAAYRRDRDAGTAAARRIVAEALDGADGIAGSADDFDAIVTAGSSGAGMFARAGSPAVVVPGGFVDAAAPVVAAAPAGVAFTARPFAEPRLIAIAYAFEQATRHRRPPPGLPALAGEASGR